MVIFINSTVIRRGKSMKIKKTAVLLTALCFIFAGVTACGGSGGDPVSDFEYRYDAELGGIEITKYVGDLVKVRIPGKIEGEPVVSIGHEAFMNSGIMEINIPDSITNIKGRAFRGSQGLTSITIPNSVTNIGGGAFSDCRGLTSVTIPDSVTSIGYGAFSGIKELTATYKGVEYSAVSGIGFHLPQEFFDAINGE